MTKKASLATALQTFDRSPPAAVAMNPSLPEAARPEAAQPVSRRNPSRVGTKALVTHFDPGVSKQLKQMALDRDTSIQELVREALNDLFTKHKKPSIA